MDSVITFLPFLLLALACPLMMVGMGVVAWVWARAQGQKTDLSISCMGGNCDHTKHKNQGDPNDEGALREQLTRLQAEVDSLRERSDPPWKSAAYDRSSPRSSSSRSSRTAN